MLPNLSAAVTGLNAEQNEMTVIANNLANQTTPGFKQGEGDFATLLSQVISAGTAPNANNTQGGVGPVQFGMGAEFTGVMPDESQGTMDNTGNPLDFAIQGSGFFVEKGTNGTFLTRDGQFALDANGNLVDRNTGNIIQGYSAVTAAENFATNPPTPATVGSLNTGTVTGLNVPQSISASGTTYDLQSWSVGQDGVITGVYADATGQTVSETLGQIVLANVPNPAGLVAAGASLFTVGPDSGPALVATPGANGAGSVLQGMLENSNTNVVQAMTDLVMTNGAYGADTKVVTVSQQMLQALDQMIP